MLIPPDWNFIIPLYQSVHTSSSSKKLAVWMKPIEKLCNNSLCTYEYSIQRSKGIIWVIGMCYVNSLAKSLTFKMLWPC